MWYHQYHVAVFSAVRHTQATPRLDPILPYDYYICLFILHLIHSSEPVKLPVWLSTPILQFRTYLAVVLWQQIETYSKLSIIPLGLD